MKSSKKYYKELDVIRVLSCLAVLLYHFNILKGGYLAVCTFFVLSAYLSVISSEGKKDFSILEYYKKTFLRVYLPLIIVVFLTISVVNLMDVTWFNLKPETKSVLLGYNNFWQLSANLDYFARHINSPFMHLWYISILLQFDIIFPFIYLGLKKIKSKLIPIITTVAISFMFLGYFFIVNYSKDIMVTYYSTFTRIFSLLFGLSLGFIHSNYKYKISNTIKNKQGTKIFYGYLLILILMFIFVDSKSIFMPFGMVLTTLISLRLIDYGTLKTEKNLSKLDKIIKSFALISYEIYLVQYPVIFIFQYININKWISIPIMIFVILLISYCIHFCLDSKNIKYKKFRYLLIGIISLISIFGLYKFCISKDHTLEMKELEKQLEQNEKIIQEKVQEYEIQSKKEEDEWLNELLNLENGEAELKNIVSNLSVVGVGDSVMLGAVPNLYEKFPNGYFDAQVSRTAWVLNGILKNLKDRDMLGDIIVLNLGANGDCDLNCKVEIIKTCEERKIFWINTTNNISFNNNLKQLSKDFGNLYVIDWKTISNGHSEYFYADGIHLTEPGRVAYTNALYDAIYNVYLEEYNKNKEQIIKGHEEELKNKITFYGNGILLNAFDYIQNDFKNEKFVINKEFDYKSLKKEVEEALNSNSLNYKVVFALDSSIKLNKAEQESLIELCSDHQVYILYINDIEDYVFDYENVKTMNFYKEIKNNKNYLMADGIHLTDEGNKAFAKALNNLITNE